MNYQEFMHGTGPGSFQAMKQQQNLPPAIAPGARSFTPGPMPAIPFMPGAQVGAQSFGQPAGAGAAPVPGHPMGGMAQLWPMIQQLLHGQHPGMGPSQLGMPRPNIDPRAPGAAPTLGPSSLGMPRPNMDPYGLNTPQIPGQTRPNIDPRAPQAPLSFGGQGANLGFGVRY